MNLKPGDRVVGGRANWKAHGTVKRVRSDDEVEPGQERSVWVKWDGAKLSEDEMDVSEVQPE